MHKNSITIIVIYSYRFIHLHHQHTHLHISVFTCNIRFHEHGQWNKGVEDNQKAVVNQRMIYIHPQLWFASPPASQWLVCCCEAKVLLMV